MASGIKQTPLFECHIGRGAKMAPFAGWNMPINYREGILAEHKHTREQASIFDICHMGEMRVAGKGAAAALDARLARPVLGQKLGVCRYNFLLNEQGGVIDDLIVYAMAEEDFFIVVNAANIDADASALQAALPAGVTFENLSDRIAKIDLQGPKSAQVLEKLGVPVAEMPAYYHCKTQRVADTPCILSRTGYTGELGFELYFDADRASDMWQTLLATDPVLPAGLGARDTLRLEVGYPLYGHELNASTSVLNAGFGAMLKLAEMPERKFFGREALEAMKPDKKLVGIQLESRRAGRAGCEVSAAGKVVGTVSSGAFGPSVGTAVAMAWLDAAAAAPGTAVEIAAGSAVLPGKVCELPFYTAGTARIKLA